MCELQSRVILVCPKLNHESHEQEENQYNTNIWRDIYLFSTFLAQRRETEERDGGVTGGPHSSMRSAFYEKGETTPFRHCSQNGSVSVLSRVKVMA